MKQLYRATVLAFAAFLFSLLLSGTPLLRSFEYKTYDLFSRLLNPQKAPQDTVIVAVDQQSLDNLSKTLVYWPWPRQIYAPIVEYLSEADAVFIDILFTEPSSAGQQDDQLFAEAVKKAANVYLPIFLTAEKRPLQQDEQDFLLRTAVKSRVPATGSFHSAVLPLDILRPALRGAGNVTIPPDEDGVYRRVPLFFTLDQMTLPNFMLSYLLAHNVVGVRDGRSYAGGTEIPLHHGALWLRYSRDSFLKIPAVDILRSALDSREAKPPQYRKDFFKGKKVFIGYTAPGLYDMKPTPVSASSTGVEVHATALSNILHKDFIRVLPGGYTGALSLFFCLAISFVLLRYHALSVNLAAFAVLFFLAALVPALLFRQAWYLQSVQPAVALVTSFMLTAVFSYATEGRQRRFIKRTFSQYMDQQLVDYVLKNPELIKPGGQRRRATVFFADIAGFTSLAEQVQPEELAQMLHHVLNEFTEVIIKNRGVIDKYIGDCVMAFWGAPVNREEDETDACHAALGCLAALERINADFSAAGKPGISVRIGIHSGDVIAGNLGSDRLFDFTVVGDTVNTASRLESANKFFSTNIMVSEDTRCRTGTVFATRELGLIEVKGKQQPVRIYELIGLQGAIASEEEQLTEIFHHALAAFREQQWQEAARLFDRVLVIRPADGPSLFYRQRLEGLTAGIHLTDRPDILRMKEK